MKMSINKSCIYTVRQVGCKCRGTVVSHLRTKLWNSCQLWTVPFLPNIQRQLEKQTDMKTNVGHTR